MPNPKINLYPSDVKNLSDAELETLSAELEQAYRLSGYEEDIWTDDAAESRYWEMHREIGRRWALANPEEAERQGRVIKGTREWLLSMLSQQNKFAKAVKDFESAGESKVGDTLVIRKPYRFVGTARLDAAEQPGEPV